ncbi:MAG TPA: hypothetical protein VIG99_27255 [Myxococcaceae bacterium]|jgi:6-phosphogluconolactonase (cycloisomerase 2 family)
MGPAGPQLAPPGVYTLMNDAAANGVVAYTRATNGNITRRGTFMASGEGLGGGLGSQGALVFDARSQRFFGVNAGDNSFSMYSLAADGSLTELATSGSGGVKPVSVTVSGSYVYVLNAGSASSAANVSGFMVSGSTIAAIPGSTQALSTAQPNPGQVGFTPDGKFLVVTEKGPSKLSVYPVTAGVAGAPMVQNSAGLTPFAFAFSPEGFLVVAEVGSSGSGPNSSVSSYSIAANGTLTAITSALPNNQAAACWLTIAGGTAYVANFGSGTISPVTVDANGALTLNGGPVATGAGATDLAVSPDNGFLYSLSATDHTIHIFLINADGSLDAKPSLSNVTQRAAGLVVR